jgi:hypothetical protein
MPKSKLTPAARRDLTAATIEGARAIGCTCSPEVVLTEENVDVAAVHATPALRFLSNLAREKDIAILATHTPVVEPAVGIRVLHDDECPALGRWADRGPVVVRA